MIVFASTGWLLVAGAFALAGGWALWRGQRRQVRFSSIRLWHGLGEESRQTRRRMVDPLWAMVLLAGILAAVAAARPGWREGIAQNKFSPAEWGVSSFAGSENFEVWVRSGEVNVDRVRLNGVETKVAAGALDRGMIFSGKGDRLEGMILAGDRVVDTVHFERSKTDGKFGLLELVEKGKVADEALGRFFGIQAGARAGDLEPLRRVVLVKGLKVSAEDLVGAALVIGEADAALPGVVVGERVESGGEGWVPEVVAGGPFAWPSFVSLKNVRVKGVQQAQFSDEWQIAARAGGLPWVAVRKVESGWWVWLGSEPADDWARDAGFVLFFAAMQERALGEGRGGGVVRWDREASQGHAGERVLELGGAVGMLGIGLLMGACGWFVWRARVGDC